MTVHPSDARVRSIAIRLIGDAVAELDDDAGDAFVDLVAEVSDPTELLLAIIEELWLASLDVDLGPLLAWLGRRAQTLADS